MKYFEKKNLNKIFIKSIGPKINLPSIKFMKIVQKKEDIKNKDNFNQKHINLRKKQSFRIFSRLMELQLI